VPGDLPYNYTLNLQGLFTNTTCSYSDTSPIDFTTISPSLLQYNGTCPTGQDIIAGTNFVTINSNSTLGFWACNTSSQGSSQESYNLYLSGWGGYTPPIGNITCSLSPVYPAVFPVTYRSQQDVFSIGDTALNSVNGTTSTDIISRSVKALGSVILDAQNSQANLVAESIITFGVKSFQLPPYTRDITYLRLYEAMIKGILEYEVRAVSFPSALFHTTSI
jgi:hypothetical protein